MTLDELPIAVPGGWTEHANPGGPRELRPPRESGLLQVSRMDPKHYAFISGAPDLGEFAAQMGQRMNGWGASSGSRAGDCAMGRFGMATFPQGEFPVMILWVTVAADTAWMWTWLGADPHDEQIRGALAVVLGTKV